MARSAQRLLEHVERSWLASRLFSAQRLAWPARPEGSLGPLLGPAPGNGAAGALESAARAYRELRFDDTIRELEAARVRLEENPLAAQDFAALRELHLLLGQSRLALGQEAGALGDFTAAARLDPAWVPTPGQYPPEVERVLARALLAVRAQPAAQLSVESEPAGAAVLLDGRTIGRTPLAAGVVGGQHWLQVKSFAHHPWRGVASLPAGRPHQLRLRLQPKTGPALDEELAAALAAGRDPVADAELASALATSAGADAGAGTAAGAGPAAGGGAGARAVVRLDVELASGGGLLLRALAFDLQRLRPTSASEGLASAAEVESAADRLARSLLRALGEPVPPAKLPLYRQWWLWTAVGVAVAGGAVTAGVLLWPRPTDIYVTGE